MKYSNVIVIALVVFIAGCASAPAQSYRPKGDDDLMMVSGKINNITNKVVITIDGKEVINDTASFWDGHGNFTGEYEGRDVAANCHQVRKLFSEYYQCLVHVDNELAATLQF